MGQQFSTITDKHRAFIERQRIFFVASAAPKGRVNVSPKGMATLRVLGTNEVGAQFWGENASKASGLEAELWCALMSDAVMRSDGTRPQATALKFGFGEKGGKNWLPRMRRFLNGAVTTDHFERLLRGERNEGMAKDICRWDPACYREHAYRAKALTADKMRQDQTINALTAIALASCASAPRRGQLVTPLSVQKEEFAWPVWTDALRLADLEASLCCGWAWPTIRARWWIDHVFNVARGALREPEVSAQTPVGSRLAIMAAHAGDVEADTASS